MKKLPKVLAAIMLMTAVAFTVGCNNTSSNSSGDKEEKTVKDDEGIGYGTFNGHEYVDLGLPSGTLWATCNVGASKPEEYGDYFAWGEISTKAAYNWSTYKYCIDGDGWHSLTKYCHYSDYGYNGFSDTLTVLQPGDDAATANIGSGWCMPTITQWMELFEKTTNTWTILNGVNGRLFIASNGTVLFLPVGGYRWGDEFYHVGLYGNYWSSSLNLDDLRSAWSIDLGSGGCYRAISGRYYGKSVRAVRSSSQN